MSEPGIASIHQASLDILDTMGITLLSEAARTLLARNGARCQGLLVKIPPDLVEYALDAVEVGSRWPPGRRGEISMCQGSSPSWRLSATAPSWRANRTGEKRTLPPWISGSSPWCVMPWSVWTCSGPASSRRIFPRSPKQIQLLQG
ncbi:MAG: trimethylamine methyltransferase family protein [Bacillota bacterium]